MLKTRTVIIASALLVLFGLLAAFTAAADFRPRKSPEKPAKSAVPDGFDRRHIEVKFADGLDVGLSTTGQPFDRQGAVLKSAGVPALLDEISEAGGYWLRMTGEDELKTDEKRLIAEQYHNRAIADLNNYFILTVPEDIETEDWLDKLNSLPEVEIALPLPLPTAPPVPNYEGQQGYLNPATDGIDAKYAWTLPGGTGANVTICDFEYSWNLAHEDLPFGIPTWVPTMYQAHDPFQADSHGTAVLGELVSMNNGWGTTGASYGANMAVAPTFLKPLAPPGEDSAWYLGVAMTNAINNYLFAGDVMLIEQQYAGPNWSVSTGDTGLIPVEWWESWYNIIMTATGNGIYVVECAGNGYQDLDNAVYNTGHAPFRPENRSGAIIVGAGSVPASYGGTLGDLSRMTFSNYGSRVDVQGWGEAVVTTGYGHLYNSEGYNRNYTHDFSGTSSAAPIVASAVALIASVNENIHGWINHMSPDRMTHLLRFTGTPQRGGVHFPWEVIGPRPDVKAAIQISGIIDTLYYKPGYIDYCPRGMPDFSMHMDSSWYGYTRWTYDGPVSLANCMWWFDSKFEPSPVDPRPFGGAVNDNYPLVQAYGSWDDHDTANVKPLIEDLAAIMTTDDTMTAPGIYEYGTWIYEMEAGVDTFLTRAGLYDSYTKTVVNFPTFDYLAEQLHASQNIILMLGFYNADPTYCCSYGAHYVNMVGVDSANKRVGIADAYTPYALSYDIQNHVGHNDADNVNYEVYQAALVNDPSCFINGHWYLSDYPDWMWMNFERINVPPSCMYGADSVYAVIEYAIVICPTEEPPLDTCTYYKASYDDFVPNGMPDIDQKQDGWKSPITGNQFWSWCGPVALTNCMWWFDSKYETSPVDPRPFYPGPGNPGPNDNYPLVQSMNPGTWDDHDTSNVQPFITQLKTLCKTDTYLAGTVISDLKQGFDSSAALAGLADDYTSNLIPGPTFELIKDSVMASKDVILLLGFYEPEFSSGCLRQGGHYVTVAGVCEECSDICISDPYLNKNESTTHGSEIHNDASIVSGPHGTHHHDRYHLENYSHTCPTPATERITDYPSDWSTVLNFVQQNTFDPGLPPGGVTEGNPIVVLVDYAMVISNIAAGDCDCSPGNANGDGTINILDITYLISNLYKGGPAPTPYPLCSGDANCDCIVNILDITYLIANLYKGGPPPCACEQWLTNCGEPLRK